MGPPYGEFCEAIKAYRRVLLHLPHNLKDAPSFKPGQSRFAHRTATPSPNRLPMRPAAPPATVRP